MGLGGGAAVNYLRHMYPEAHIDVVEMDDVVIQVITLLLYHHHHHHHHHSMRERRMYQ
jgi:spermidine synthase